MNKLEKKTLKINEDLICSNVKYEDVRVYLYQKTNILTSADITKLRLMKRPTGENNENYSLQMMELLHILKHCPDSKRPYHHFIEALRSRYQALVAQLNLTLSSLQSETATQTYETEMSSKVPKSRRVSSVYSNIIKCPLDEEDCHYLKMYDRLGELTDQGSRHEFQKEASALRSVQCSDKNVELIISLVELKSDYFGGKFKHQDQHVTDTLFRIQMLIPYTTNPKMYSVMFHYMNVSLRRCRQDFAGAWEELCYAKQHMSYLEPCRLTASVLYHEASLLASEEPTKESVENTIACYHQCVEHYLNDQSMNNDRKAQVALGKLAVFLCGYGESMTNRMGLKKLVTDSHLRTAKKCLDTVENDMWATTSISRFYLNLGRSDYSRRKGDLQRTLHHARTAEAIAEESGFKNELRHARKRLSSLNVLESQDKLPPPHLTITTNVYDLSIGKRKIYLLMCLLIFVFTLGMAIGYMISEFRDWF